MQENLGNGIAMKAGLDGKLNQDIEQLVRNAQRGDQEAFGELYEHFYDKIFRYVSFKSGKGMDAEDITGEVFLKMLNSIHSFKWKGYPFSSCLYRIAHNLVIDHYRKNSKLSPVPLSSIPYDNLPTNAMTLEDSVNLNQSVKRVQDAMKNLTDLQHEVIALRFAAELTIAETAFTIGRKKNAVKALQHSGLKKLRRSLISEPQISGRISS